MTEKQKNNSARTLTIRVLLGIVFGAIVGLVLQSLGSDSPLFQWLVEGILKIGADVFVASLKMLVVPLVFVSLVCGVMNLDDLRELGRLGTKTLGLYLLTTGIALTVAISIAALIHPGEGFQMAETATFTPKEGPSLVDVISGIVPSNPIQAAAKGDMLQIIVFAILFGLGIVLAREKAKKVAVFFEELNEIIMKMVAILMNLAPFGVFAVMAKIFAVQGLDVIQPLAKYFLLTLSLLFFHQLVIYGGLLTLFCRVNPIRFFAQMRDTVLFAFSTASSNATIPVTMKTVIDKLGVNKSVASFTVPLGATINMDGTAIMQGVATVFIADVYGIEVGFTGYLTVVVTATLASIGTAGVPGVGLITLAMVLRQIGLPVEGIGLILGVDRLLDMVRTFVNVTGDATVSCVVANSEGQFNKDVFYQSQEMALEEELHEAEKLFEEKS